MVRFYGWDGSGLPVRSRRSAFLQEAVARTGASAHSTEVNPTTSPSICYDEIVALALGLIAGMRYDDIEIRRLYRWCAEFAVDPNDWPAGVIARRLDSLYSKGTASDQDAEDLVLLLEDMAGDVSAWSDSAREIPFSFPIPVIEFADREFAFVGHLLNGLDRALDETARHKARFATSVSESTDYLVIGAVQSARWHANGIAEAIQSALMASERVLLGKPPTAILSEEAWWRAIADAPQIFHSNPAGSSIAAQ
jgi:hypothetical protein